ncbi:hypothetical protein [Cohnella panacarvi]|uniref:hypothetical protein n=1 Tax=Cohnella panacarvi TaxID=400776 RepID=UPI00047AACA6|nr:hypothetical protein [Cohnella panacarvi]
MNEWSATIWASLSAMAAAIVISFVVLLGSMARESANVMHEQDTAIEILKEHRKYSPYDGTSDLFAQDLISAIAESGGYPVIQVYTGLSSPDQLLTWERRTSPLPSGAADPFSVEELTGKFNDKFGNLLDSARFRSEIIRDANGAVSIIRFRRQ